MGPSGSGKTTLLGAHLAGAMIPSCHHDGLTKDRSKMMIAKLKCHVVCADVLAGRKTAGKTQGTVLFAGVKPSSMFLRRYTGYVEQFGEFSPLWTILQGRIVVGRLSSQVSFRTPHVGRLAPLIVTA